jgi:hypothetical protein
MNLNERAQKTRLKVTPINNEIDKNRLNIEVKQKINTQNPFTYKISTNTGMMETPNSIMTPSIVMTPSSMMVDIKENTSRTRDRSRPRFQFAEAIVEQEEEGKGTIDFPNGTSMK